MTKKAAQSKVQAKFVNVKDLMLDPENFRTTRQKTESDAFNAIVMISPKYVWGLMHSLLDDGYLPTENIIAIDNGKKIIVKEGNRRIGSIKVLLGLLKIPTELPDDIKAKLASKTPEELQDLQTVPCNIYSPSDEAKVDRIIARTHGKGESAGRDKWEAMATARHNKAHGGQEYAFDLIDKFLSSTTSVSTDEKLRWAGNYPLTVLEDMIRRREITSWFGASSAKELSEQYPDKVTRKSTLEEMLAAIGSKEIQFKNLREAPLYADLLDKYGIKESSADESKATNPTSGSGATAQAANAEKDGTASTTGKDGNKSSPATPERAKAIDDVGSVKKYLRALKLRGQGLEKAEAIRKEMVAISVTTAPFAFVFLLRSLLEISAKAYIDANPNTITTKYVADGQDRNLFLVLKDLINEIAPKVGTKDTSPPAVRDAKKLMHKRMKPALVTLSNEDGLLSITAMNSAVHNGVFSIPVRDLCREFHNLTPLINELVGAQQKEP